MSGGCVGGRGRGDTRDALWRVVLARWACRGALNAIRALAPQSGSIGRLARIDAFKRKRELERERSSLIQAV